MQNIHGEYFFHCEADGLGHGMHANVGGSTITYFENH